MKCQYKAIECMVTTTSEYISCIDCKYGKAVHLTPKLSETSKWCISIFLFILCGIGLLGAKPEENLWLAGVSMVGLMLDACWIIDLATKKEESHGTSR
jgi:hypothetical protein